MGLAGRAVAAYGGPTSTPSTVRVEPSAAPSLSIAPGDVSPAALPSIDAPWAQTDLADVATGESYRIADLTGRVVIVETMAIWCVKCLAQQRVSSRSVWDFATNLDSIRLTFGM